MTAAMWTVLTREPSIVSIPMGIVISATDLELIARHCEAQYPMEGCGILIGKVEEGSRIVVDLLLTENSRQEKRRYSIPPEQLLQGELLAEEQNLQVIGYFHSHPDHPAQPSAYDLELGWPGYSYLILAVRDGVTSELRSWQLKSDRSGFTEEPVKEFAPDPPLDAGPAL